MKKCLLIAFLFLAFGQLNAQDAIIRNFKATPAETYMVLSWTTDSGYTCATLYLYHSLDSVNYLPIYLFPGVCGSFQESQSYNYIHSDPAPNQINYYRLTASTYNQELNTQAFFKDGSSFYLYPNPANGYASLYINNTPVNYELEVISALGELVYTQQGYADKIGLDVSTWKNGKYIFQLLVDNQKFTGTFLVAP